MTKTSSLAGLAALALTACVFEPADLPDLPPPSSDSIALARAQLAGAVHLLLVTGDAGETIDAVDLGPLEEPALGRVAARGIDGLLADAAEAPRVRVAYADLLPPVDPGVPGIEVGASYPDPVNAVPSPFLFPNHAVPAAPIGAVEGAGAELLDYQVGLCVTLGAPVPDAAAAANALLGFFLCQHFIDRGIQLRETDLEHPERALGSTRAGRRRGYWRTGPYLYHTRDPHAYAALADLRLEVNDRLRQDAPVSSMRWSVEEILVRTLATGSSPSWTVDGVPTRLYTGAALPAGLTVMTGTPAGVVYQPPPEDFIDDAREAYILDAIFLTGVGFDAYMKDEYIAQERASGRYLRAGDRVEASGTYLGRLAVTIE